MLNTYIRLDGVQNARELGGLPLANGRSVRRGCLIRSGRLSDMTEQDRLLLSEQWHVTHILDLRNQQEAAEHPDLALPGAQYCFLPVFSSKEIGVTREDGNRDIAEKAIAVATMHRGGGARRLLEGIYPKMVLEENCLQQIRRFFGILLDNEEGAVIWHCTSGKDRTGVTAALLLSALGASWETVIEDYLQTNEQVRDYREGLCRAMQERGAQDDLIEEIRVLESVDRRYLDNCRQLIEQRYGGMEAFLEVQLGLTPERRSRLQEKYTCGPAK